MGTKYLHKWDANQLTQTLKGIKDRDVIRHIGDRVKHLADQLAVQRAHHKRVLKSVGIELPGGDDSLQNILESCGFGSQGQDERSVAAALEQRGILLTAVYRRESDDPSEPRAFAVVPGNEFTSFVEGEVQVRANYRDKNYNAHSRTDLALEALYCRLPPWFACIVKTHMRSNPSKVPDILDILARDFSKRFNVDSIGIALHSENENDYHVHIIFSRSLERLKVKNRKSREARREKTRLHGIIRSELKGARKPATPKAVAEALRTAVNSGRFRDPEEGITSIEFVRREKYSGEADIRIWGPAYRNKHWVLRAARGHQRELVAASNDRAAQDPGGFRFWIADLKAQNTSPVEHFSDVWTERLWQKICMAELSRDELKKVSGLRGDCVRNYLEIGKTLPTPIETIAAHLLKEREVTRELAANLDVAKAELSWAKSEITELHENLDASQTECRRARSNCGELETRIQRLEEKDKTLEADVVEATEMVPPLLRGGSPVETIRLLTKENSMLRTAARAIVECISNLHLPENLVDQIRKLGAVVGITVPPRKGLDKD